MHFYVFAKCISKHVFLPLYQQVGLWWSTSVILGRIPYSFLCLLFGFALVSSVVYSGCPLGGWSAWVFILCVPNKSIVAVLETAVVRLTKKQMLLQGEALANQHPTKNMNFAADNRYKPSSGQPPQTFLRTTAANLPADNRYKPSSVSLCTPTSQQHSFHSRHKTVRPST